jgi:hypothetical protein
MSALEPTDFEKQRALQDAEGRYRLEERAAIHEFEGRLDRAEAERRAVREMIREQQCKRA